MSQYLRSDNYQEGKHLVSIEAETMEEENPDLSYLTEYQGGSAGETYTDEKGKKHTITKVQEAKWRQQDKDRLESYGRTWWHIGVKAEAIIYVEGVRQIITSGGLWGIESDSNEKYIEEEKNTQIKELEEILLSLGFTKKQIEEVRKK